MNTEAFLAKKQDRLSIRPISVTLLIMLALAFFIKSNMQVIPAVDATAANQVFSAERAKNMLTDLLKEGIPHPVDSDANRVVERRIVDRLRSMGFQEEIQQAVECRDFSLGVARCTQVRNIIVTIDGTHSAEGDGKNGILLSAHYDSVGAGPGASDAGSAVATLLEITRMLSLEERPRNSIVLLFNEGEEFGLFGAHAFMRHHPLAKGLKLAINIEARGSDGQSVMFETGEKSGWLVEEYIASTPAPLSSSLFYEVYKILPNDTDLTVFKEHGLQGLNFAHGGNEPHYHTPLDNLSNLKLGTIQHHGENVWGVLERIKNKDFSDELNEKNIVYSDIIGQFVIQWQESTSLIVSVILCLLFVVVAKQFSNKQMLQGKSILKGVYGFFIMVILLTLLALLMQKFTQVVSGGNEPWRVNNFPMQLTLWASLSFVGLVIGRWLAKKASPINLLLGLLMCWLVLSVVTSLLMVGISYLFIVPSLIAILMLLILPFIKSTFGEAAIGSLLVIVSAVVGIIFLPIVYVLELMVSYKMSLAIGLMLSIVISSLIPLTAFSKSAVSHSNKLNYTFALVFVIGFTWTVTQPLYSVFIPQPLNITHIQNDDGQSYIAVGNNVNQSSEQLQALMNDGQLGQAVVWSTVESINKPINDLQLPKANVDILSTQQSNEIKTVRLNIDSTDENLRDLVLYFPQSSKLKSIQYAGKTLTYDNESTYRNGYYEFQCRGLSCQSVDVELTFLNAKEVEMTVVKSLSGIPDSDLEYSNARGEKAVQRQFGDKTIIISKVKI